MMFSLSSEVSPFVSVEVKGLLVKDNHECVF